MNNLTKVVKWSVIIIIILIVLYDIVLSMLGYTISRFMRDWESFEGWWIAPYYGSIILGHWWIHFWNRTNQWIKWVPYRYIILIGMGILTLVLNMTISSDVLYLPWYITIPGGLISGALLWPQLSKREKLEGIS